MKRTFFTVALAVSVIGVASAQAPADKPVGVALRVGAFLPSDRGAKNEGSQWIGFGVDYKLVDLKLDKTNPGYAGSVGLSVDYYGKGSYSNVPILANYCGSVGPLFYDAGVGVGFTKIAVASGTDSKTRFAYGAGVGYQFEKTSPTPVFLEVKYFGSTRTEVNGFGIYAGIRF